MRLVLPVIAVGRLASAALARDLRNLLYGVTPTDPLTMAAAAILLTLVPLLACRFPARRTARVDPMTALRREG